MSRNNDQLWILPGSKMDVPSSEVFEAVPSLTASVSGRFEFRRRLGQGGMGTVYEAMDTLRGEPVAIKMLVPGLLQDAEAIRQFQTEAAVMMRLNHPNIVTVFGFHTFDGAHGIVMELLRGRTLRDVMLERNRSHGATLSPAEAWVYLQPLCRALEYAHEFTVHRDLKPENVWVGDDGGVKLMDFGLAKLMPRGADPISLHTLSQLRLGSPYYTAPEQLQDARRATPAADQFSLGVLAYELLSGSLPVGLARPLRELRPDLPYQLTDVVDRSLSSDPAKRFASVAEWSAAFQRGLQARRSWRQFLDAHPRIRQGALVLLVGGFCAGGVTWVGKSMQTRASSLNARIHATQDAYFQAKTQTRAVQRQVELAREARAEAAAHWESVRLAVHPPPPEDLPPPVRNPDDDGNVERTLEIPDPPKQLNDELRLARAENAFVVADLAWRWLAPRLGGDGDLPKSLFDAISAMEFAIAERDFDAFARAQDAFANHHDHESRVIASLRPLAEARTAVASLRREPAEMPESNAPSTPPVAPAWPIAPDAALPAEGEWAAAIARATAEKDTLMTARQSRFQSSVEAEAGARAEWAGLFTPKVGPPPIEFLGFPTAKAEAALAFAEMGRYDRAQPLLDEAVAIVKGWTEEVTALHRRCEPAWAKAKAEGRAYEDVLGMRYVRVEDPDYLNYWSIWETRVMDFARFVAAGGRGSESAGELWKHPGFAIGPTHPVTWIDRSVASGFALWYSKLPQASTIGAEGIGLARGKAWRWMLGGEPEWRQAPIQSAIMPSENELRERHWHRWYSDPRGDPGRHIRPVGLGPPSAHGLYDLFGNVWEWALEAQTFAPDHRAFGVLFGGGVFGQISLYGETPPQPNIAFVNRGEAIGFRMILNGEVLEKNLKILRDATTQNLSHPKAESNKNGEPKKDEKTTNFTNGHE